MKYVIFAGFVFASVTTVVATTNAQREAGGAQRPPSDTLLHVPDADYRKQWTLLGTFSVLADDPSQGAKEMHVVYAKPETVDAYRKTGVFPDGAVIVKDVFATTTEPMTTGTVSFAKTLIGRFVMVRQPDDRYAATSPLWGDGWGWAFYEGAETRKTVTTDYRENCLACHEPARGTDFIYTQGYPVLRR